MTASFSSLHAGGAALHINHPMDAVSSIDGAVPSRYGGTTAELQNTKAELDPLRDPKPAVKIAKERDN